MSFPFLIRGLYPKFCLQNKVLNTYMKRETAPHAHEAAGKVRRVMTIMMIS